MSIEKLRKYFLKLIDYSNEIITYLPIDQEPKPLKYVLERLKLELDSMKNEKIRKLKNLDRPLHFVDSTDTKLGTGLNSIGMLTDRLTILIIKEWCLRNKNNLDPEKADKIYKEQTLDIVEAIIHTKPGSSSMNTKITKLRSGARASSWEEAYYGLLKTNILMWESQEVLYIKDISLLKCEELREYIKWFSFSNILRNEYINLCEKKYWEFIYKRER
jgi:hypothetical protein